MLFRSDKENGGKADALNAALNAARSPYVLAVDADTILDPDALLRLSRPFSLGEPVAAVGGALRVANGCRVENGRVVETRVHSQWMTGCQSVEYLRAFLFGRLGWNRVGGNLIISGAFGLFRRDHLMAIGGYRTSTVGEDMDLVIRLRRYLYEHKIPGLVPFVPDSVAWTEVPSTLRVLGAQRERWQRGLVGTMVANSTVFLNPRYGAMGMIAYPWFVFAEMIAPLAEAVATVQAIEIDRALADRAHVVIAQIPVVQTATGVQVQLPDVDAIAAGGAVVQVTGFDGTIVRSALLGRATLPLSEAARRATEAGESSFETIEVEGVRLRIATAPLAWRGETLGVLLVARPLGATEVVTGGLRLVLVGTGAVVLVVGAAGSWLVTRRALRPLDDFAREAHVIGRVQDFSRRLPPDVIATVSEVGTLGTTFNAMLDRLQEAYGAVQEGNLRLEATLQAQRRFVADASHELRTPLTTIRGNAQLLQRGTAIADADREEMVGQVASEAERMARLVGDLLTLARADGGLVGSQIGRAHV